MKISIQEFCKKHPHLAGTARTLIVRRSVTPGKDGLYSESLLATAAAVTESEDRGSEGEARRRVAATIRGRV